MLGQISRCCSHGTAGLGPDGRHNCCQNVSICWAALCCNTTAAVRCPPIQWPCHRPRHGSGAAQAAWLGGCTLAAVTDARGGFAAIRALTAQAVQGSIPQAAGCARQAVSIRACSRRGGLEQNVCGQAASAWLVVMCESEVGREVRQAMEAHQHPGQTAGPSYVSCMNKANPHLSPYPQKE